ncbi:tRNA (adenosine(37)-N6)-threonylcarbamoyltransferase complex dimerization subunit type 1 TsaB [Buchnera aphidicola]|uniref:tRNA (adenosine(37)-N6)-threonylcarbamoyltransferase complex dimerization subunit type 1 TsaB n=1 Tax=Buchnera aphidicola TaxID=9 RepID=UPI0030EBE911
MKILSFDSSYNSCSVSLLYKKKIFYYQKKCKRQHSKILFPMIKKILFVNKIKLKKINIIAFCNGPGNFTGTRISTNIAQGLSIGSNIPLLQISSLKIIAQEAYNNFLYEKNFFIIMKMNKNRYYYSKYLIKKNFLKKKKKFLSTNKKILLQHLNKIKKRCVFAGNFNPKILKSLKFKNFFIKIKFSHAKYIIPLALKDIKLKKTLVPELVFTKYFHKF